MLLHGVVAHPQPGGAAIVYNNDVVETAFTTAVITMDVTIPTAAEGDLIVVVGAFDGLPTITSSSGYDVTYQTGAQGATCGVFFKIAGASEPTTATFGVVAKEEANWHACTFSGVNATTPNVQSTTNSGTGTNNATCGPLDVDTGNLVIHAIALDGGSTDDVTAVPSNTTIISVTNTMSAGGAAAGSAYHIPLTDGNFTTNAWTHTSDGWVTYMVEFLVA